MDYVLEQFSISAPQVFCAGGGVGSSVRNLSSAEGAAVVLFVLVSPIRSGMALCDQRLVGF